MITMEYLPGDGIMRVTVSGSVLSDMQYYVPITNGLMGLVLEWSALDGRKSYAAILVRDAMKYLIKQE